MEHKNTESELHDMELGSGKAMSHPTICRQIAGRGCRIYQQGNGGPVFFWGCFANRPEQITELASQFSPKESFLLIAFESKDWDGDFSPWPARLGDRAFAGNGDRLLEWLTREATSWVEERYPDFTGPRCIMGYSLAGLFALWAFYNSDKFAQVCSCSGSLWYPGWEAFVQQNRAPRGSCTYLSLGGKEPASADARMAQIGDLTKWQDAVFGADENVIHHSFVWEKGGHFANPQKRLAAGMKWLLDCGL